VGRYPFVLFLAVPGDLDNVAGLIREAADWLGSKGIDQWQEPWPDRAGQRERILNDLFKGKTWLVRDGVAKPPPALRYLNSNLQPPRT
jgi:hypothetical protein